MENLELVRELYRRVKVEGTFPRELLDEDVEYVNPPDAIEGGTRRGRDEFEAATRTLDDAFEEMRVEIDDLIDTGGDEVVVLLTFVVTGRGSGLIRRQPQGHVWTVRDGRAHRFRWFNDPAQALRAAGLEQSA